MSSSNCCVLTCIQVSQEAGQVVWHSHLFHTHTNGLFLNILFHYSLLLLFSHLVMSDFFLTPRTLSHQAPLSMGFSRQEYWSGWPFPSPEDRPDPGIELASPPLAGGFFTIEPIEKLHYSLSQDIEYNSLDCTVGPCCLSILYTIVCIRSYDFVFKVLLSWKECPLKW